MAEKPYPPINLWPDHGKGDPGPNELQKKYFIDRLPPHKRPHLHPQDVLLSIGGVGSGKSFRKGTPVLLFDGSIKNVEDIVVGDLLMGPDSTSRTVLELGRGEETFYKVVPIKGDPFFCNESHILSLKNIALNVHEERIRADGSIYIKPPRYGGPDVINVSVKEFLTWSKRKRSYFNLYRADQITFPDSKKKFHINPYILGIWLGDGSSATFEITAADDEIINFLVKKGFTDSPIKGREHIHRLKKIGKNSQLRKIGVFNNKHIPHEYKTASVEDRLALLAGLIDTDGYVGSNCIEIIQKRKILAEDIVFIARSLGFAAYIHMSKKSWTHKGIKKSDWYYRVSISGSLEDIPTILPRKKCTTRKQKKRVNVTGFKLEKIESEPYYGVVLNKDHLFLLGDFTVVHNSWGAVARLIDQARLWPGIQIYLGAFNMKILARNIWQPFEEILLKNRNRKDKHPFLTKTFSEQSQFATFVNGSNVQCINLKENLKENIGFSAGLLIIDEVHLLPDEEALKLLIGRARGIPPEIRQVILCTNPQHSKQGWMNHTFNLSIFDGVDTTDGPVEKLVGPKCRCQVCTTCSVILKKDIEWVKKGNDMVCPSCKTTKDFYTWKGEKFWCPGDQQYWRVIKSESHHNTKLPADYYQGMQDMYDEKYFDIMVRGKTNTDLREDYVANKYHEEQILPSYMDIDWGKPLFWGLDFNLQPQCSVIGQYETIGEKLHFVCKNELVLYGPTEANPYGKANAPDVANAFVKRYKEYYLGQPVFIFCDPHGWGGQTHRELSKPLVLEKILLANGFDVHLITDEKTMPIKERIDALNEACTDEFLLFNPDGHAWSPKHTLASMSELKWKEMDTNSNVKDDFDRSGDNNAKRAYRRDKIYVMTHPLDALSYIIYHEYSVLKDMKPEMGMSVVGQSHTYIKDDKVEKTMIEAPEASKKVEERVGNEARETEESKARKRHAEQMAAEIERINNQSIAQSMGLGGFFTR